MDLMRELIAQSMPHLIDNVQVTVTGPTLSFTLDSSGTCAAARSSENGVTTMLGPTLYDGKYWG